jgi:hypothetical protein
MASSDTFLLQAVALLLLLAPFCLCSRPPPSHRKFVSPAIDGAIADIKSRMKDPVLAAMFENCLPNTLDTTVCIPYYPTHAQLQLPLVASLPMTNRHGDHLAQVQYFTVDGSGQPDSFIITGDIGAMWLRDSTNQACLALHSLPGRLHRVANCSARYLPTSHSSAKMLSSTR